MLVRRFGMLFVVLSVALGLYAQMQEILPRGTAPAAADVAYARRWQPWGNPAALASEDKYSLSAGYENRYLSWELHDAYFSLAVPTQYVNVGAAFNFFGYDLYREMMASLTASKRWGRVAVGVEFDYFNMFIAEEGVYHHAFTAEVGLQVWATDKCVVGFRMFNPMFSRVRGGPSARRLPVMIDVGCGYTFIRSLDVICQLGYVLNQGFRWNVGVEYRIIDELIVRLGICGYNVNGLNRFVPSLGAGLRFGIFGFDLAADYDPRLGVSLCSNISFSF